MPDNELEGKLYDTNKNGLYWASDYLDSEAGVFFAALEANGHVYAFILDKDCNAEVINRRLTRESAVQWLLTMIPMKVFCG